MTENQKLLSEYVKGGSEAAFRELVARYTNLVYSVAVRLTNGDSQLAEDIGQRVFSDLARKAHSLSQDVMLGGWLHRHTCFVAATMMRAERRRQNREREAVQMNAIKDHSDANLAEVAPMLDEAINLQWYSFQSGDGGVNSPESKVTAVGLAAAIPASIFYNLFGHQLKELGERMDDFGLEFLNMVDRGLGE